MGHIMSNGDIKIDVSKVKAITEMKAPSKKKELKMFLGMVNIWLNETHEIIGKEEHMLGMGRITIIRVSKC